MRRNEWRLPSPLLGVMPRLGLLSSCCVSISVTSCDGTMRRRSSGPEASLILQKSWLLILNGCETASGKACFAGALLLPLARQRHRRTYRLPLLQHSHVLLRLLPLLHKPQLILCSRMAAMHQTTLAQMHSLAALLSLMLLVCKAFPAWFCSSLALAGFLQQLSRSLLFRSCCGISRMQLSPEQTLHHLG